MTEVTIELLYEVLRKVQGDIGDLKVGQNEIKAELRAIRGHMLAIQTDVSNLYSGQAELKSRLERVERRFNLTDERQ